MEIGDQVSPIFFSPDAGIIKAIGADLQLFAYESAESMENQAPQVTADGGSIGTARVTWLEKPYFYQAGR